MGAGRQLLRYGSSSIDVRRRGGDGEQRSTLSPRVACGLSTAAGYQIGGSTRMQGEGRDGGAGVDGGTVNGRSVGRWRDFF